MTNHLLDAAAGYPSPYAVVRRAPFSSAQLATIAGGIAYQGRCVHLNNSEQWEFGIGADKVAHFLFTASDSPDAYVDGGDPQNDYQPSGHSVSPELLALSATGAYELRTTEFDDTQTYVVNQPLTAATGTTLATAGVLTNQGASYAAGTVCGVVSRNRAPGDRGQDNRSQLYFYPVFLPLSTI